MVWAKIPGIDKYFAANSYGTFEQNDSRRIQPIG